MIEDTLRMIGLTDGEIKVYLTLLELGSSTSGKITKHCGISGSKVYEVLDRLRHKGLSTFVVQNGVKHFEASSPDKILSYLDEKEQEINKEKLAIRKIIPKLILRQQSAESGVAKIYTGWEGLKTANEDIIGTLKKGEEWLSMGLTEQPKSWEAHFNKRQKVRAKKGIVHKHLLNEKYKSLYKTRKVLPHTEFRFLPKELEMPTSTEVYGNKVAILILSPKDPMAIIIESKAVAESFRRYFSVLWESSKPLKA